MTAQPTPTLELTATFPTLGERTGVFEFPKSSVVEKTRTEQFLNNSFDQTLSSLSDFSDALTGNATAKRRGVYKDQGGGQHIFEVDLETLGADDGQWGYSDDPNVLNAASATGGDRVQKSQVFHAYFQYGLYGSFSPAKFKYGEYSPDGVMPRDYIGCLVENPETSATRDQASSLTQSLIIVDVFALAGPGIDIEIPDPEDVIIPFGGFGQPL